MCEMGFEQAGDHEGLCPRVKGAASGCPGDRAPLQWMGTQTGPDEVR